MLFNTTIIFYMVKFGRLLCPNFDKAWTCDQIAQHTGSNNYYAAVRGIIYDVSSLAHGDHSDVPGLARASIAMSCEFSLFFVLSWIVDHVLDSFWQRFNWARNCHPSCKISLPRYTEGEGSLRCTNDSLASLRYDDKRTPIFMLVRICDVSSRMSFSS
jgi:hypothetical protein